MDFKGKAQSGMTSSGGRKKACIHSKMSRCLFGTVPFTEANQSQQHKWYRERL